MNKKPKEVLFIHHSVGRNIINTGLKENLKKQNILMTDIDYNRIGILDENNNKVEGPNIPNDDTNSEGIIKMLNNEEIINYFNSFDLVIMKSCYTTFICKSESKFKVRIKAIKKLGELITKISPKVILVTPPPLSKFRYLMADKEKHKKIIKEYDSIENNKDMAVFNLHRVLSMNDKWLNKEYKRKLFFNSHPNNFGSLKASIALFNEIIRILN